MDEIIRRLEQASGPDRELDYRISVSDPEPPRVEHSPVYPPRYTASIDAALTLVPEGNYVEMYVEMRRHSDGWYCWISKYRDATPNIVTQKPAAIAICIAALKARTALSSGQRGAD